MLPRDAAGQVGPVDGKVVLISIGMSHTTQEFQKSVAATKTYGNLDDKLVIVDGAQGGKDASAWANPSDAAWSVPASRLSNVNVTPARVQAVWSKEQFVGDDLGAFPQGARNLRNSLASIARNARAKYPNLALGYVAGRIYICAPARSAGAYQQGWAVEKLIQDQVNGASDLAYVAGGVAPWLSWGPYMWAGGLGADDEAIHDAVLIASAFCMFDRYVDGLGAITPGDPAVYDRIGATLVAEGYLPRAAG